MSEQAFIESPVSLHDQRINASPISTYGATSIADEMAWSRQYRELNHGTEERDMSKMEFVATLALIGAAPVIRAFDAATGLAGRILHNVQNKY